jgi:hypothetical protein
MKIEIDLEKQISDAVADAIAPEKIGALIQKNVSAVVDDAVKSAFSYSSQFRKLAETSIAQLMPHELKLDKQADWNHFITQAITERVAALNDQRLKEAIAPVLDQLLDTPPESIKLSELVRALVKNWRERGDVNSTHQLVVESSATSDGYKDIYISKDKMRSNYSADVRLRVDRDNRVWAINLNGDDLAKQKFAGPYFNVEQQLFQLYACKTKIEIDVRDIDDIDLEFDESEDSDD